MGRLEEKMARAGAIVGKAEASLEAEADKLIAREDQFERRKQLVFAKHHARLDGHHKGMDKLESMLNLLDNGDPLESSGEPVKSPPAVVQPDQLKDAQEAAGSNLAGTFHDGM